MTQHRDHEELHRALADNIDTRAEGFFGKQRSRSSRGIRFGKKGSVAVVTRGSKAGSWFDHSEGRGGGPIDLIERELGLDYLEAVEWARRWLKWPANEPTCLNHETSVAGKVSTGRAAIKAQQAELEALEVAEKRSKAQRLWSAAVPIKDGDPADLYLTKTRGIPRPVTGWPSDAIRSNHSGLVALAKCGDILSGGQAISLTSDGRKRPDDSGIAKRSFGAISGAVTRLAGNAAGPILIAEGLETGLSLWAATGCETWITLGIVTLAKLEKLPQGRTVVLCRDDDGHSSPPFNAVRKVQRHLLGLGYKVRIATPWPEQRQDKSDFNDVMVTLGPQAIRDRIMRAAEYWPSGIKFVSVHEGRTQLSALVERFFAEPQTACEPTETAGDVIDGPHLFEALSNTIRSAVWAISATMALGKTEAVLTAIRRRIEDMRTSGDKRCVVIAVPYHRLSNDLLSRAEAKGLRARVWRGQASKDSDGELMCRNLEEAQNDAKLLIPSKVTCGECPMRDGCRYLAQYDPAEEDRLEDVAPPLIDVWIVAHQLLFSSRFPRPIRKQGYSHLIVDESIHPAAIGEPKIIALEGMLNYRLPDDPCDASDLHLTRSRICEAVRRLPDGTPLHRRDLEAVGLAFDEVSRAVVLEWSRMVRSKEDEELVREHFLPNASLAGMVSMFEAAKAILAPFAAPDECASGWLEATTTSDSCKALIVRSRKQISVNCPTLLINGTLGTELEKLLFPCLEVVAEIKVDIPHQHISQVTDRTFYNGYLKHPEVQQGLRTAAILIALRTGRKGLLITNKATGEAIRPMLPSYINVANYGAIAGRDEWRGRDLLLAGRNQIPASEAEDAVMSLTGRAVDRVRDGNYPLCDRDRFYRLDDGSIVSHKVQAAQHPDPLVEAYRWHACEGQLVQALARPRAMTYGTAEKPIFTLVATDTPLPVPINAEITGSEIINPPDWAQQFEAGGIVLETKDHAMKAYPSLYKGRQTRPRGDVWDRPNWPLPSSSEQEGANPGKYPYQKLHP
ncbi:MAG: toprim domain-containing protein, partial [Alphaproteobacteria bacterium]|nr:toprim domain-containing protein [Alphaproteobacteria bacterium]